MRNLLLLCTALAGAAPLMAQGAAVPAPSQTAQGDVSVTIYNNDRALVEDKRLLDIPAGRSRQEFRDVSAQIQPETVTLNGRGLDIVGCVFALGCPEVRPLCRAEAPPERAIDGEHTTRCWLHVPA